VHVLLKVRFLLVVMVAVATTVASQNAPPSSRVIPKYDLTTEVRVRGIVVDTNDHLCPISGGLGSHLVLKTADGTLEVHLAPTKFVNEYQLILARGDNIEVLGSRVMIEGKEALMARQITRGEETFVFRDANGKPVW
jgi:DNA/RNA endonuclease YhcR with UshA esterase domain